MLSLLYLLLALIGLGFLIFIHELGHYFMARRVGMRVDTFKVGLGRPLYTWESNGTKWQIGWLLFGGYVKIAGTETDSEADLYSIKDGFFGKSPLDRILVALAGPVVNLIFALVAFAILWGVGGRAQNFTEHTRKIGWIDPKSELYAQGIRPGDEITAYDGHDYNNNQDHLQAPMTSSGELEVSGYRVNYNTKERTPFNVKTSVYPHPLMPSTGLVTGGILTSANYVIYNKLADDKENPIPENTPLYKSGIEYGDRIAWVDGELIFSNMQLNRILNDNRVLLTIDRQGKKMLKRVPRVEVQELKLDPAFKDELTDWQFEANLQNARFSSLYIIPYNLTNDAVVENVLHFIDREQNEQAFADENRSEMEKPLQEGDRIIAIDGKPIQHAHQLLKDIQQRQVLVIVERQPARERVNWYQADATFDSEMNLEALNKITQSIGTDKQVINAGPYHLLKPVTPISWIDFLRLDNNTAMLQQIEAKQKELTEIPDNDKRAQALRALQIQQNEVILGIPNVQDQKVWFNPNPFAMFSNVFNEIWRVLTALFTGALSPKWLMGPVGIVQAIHTQTMGSIANALYWLGVVSLNLGIFNLIPIPVLDGGTILMSLFEMVSGKRIKPKTMERLILPFAIFLIGFFIFVTFHDINRIFKFFW